MVLTRAPRRWLAALWSPAVRHRERAQRAQRLFVSALGASVVEQIWCAAQRTGVTLHAVNLMLEVPEAERGRDAPAIVIGVCRFESAEPVATLQALVGAAVERSQLAQFVTEHGGRVSIERCHALPDLMPMH